ncbi:hypothetical protein EYF80_049707 [Liparis tanakae]|uniref:Uncharacterized protein n=1 Tax=Liparis tanakae TaxID=230148 RepID=A0A4Z2FGU6_9TELE|nr:hypothetical protein EYF80_049707 [Liparis tanakae]
MSRFLVDGAALPPDQLQTSTGDGHRWEEELILNQHPGGDRPPPAHDNHHHLDGPLRLAERSLGALAENKKADVESELLVVRRGQTLGCVDTHERSITPDAARLHVEEDGPAAVTSPCDLTM